METNPLALLGLLNPQLSAQRTRLIEGAVAIAGLQFNGWKHEVAGATPDASNARIASLMGTCAAATGLPVFAQSEHAVLLREVNVPIAEECWAGWQEHVATHTYMRWLAERMCSIGKGNRVIIYAHRHHLWRITVLARYYGLDPIFPVECISVPYDPSGTQLWAGRPALFFPWEYLVARPGTLALSILGKL